MHVLHVIGRRSGAKANPGEIAQIEAVGRHVRIHLHEYEASSLANYLRAALVVRRLASTRDYDLVHAHFSRSALLACLAGGRVPIVVSYMGTDLLGRHLTNRCIARCLARVAAHQIVQSREMAARLSGPAPVSIMPNGVDLERFRPMDRRRARKVLGLAQDRDYVLFVGNPARKEKNYKLAESAVARVRRSGHASVEVLTLHDQPHERVCTFLNASDVVLLTSFYEGSPNIIKEALACNRPIVATDVGDIREHIEEVAGCCLTGFDSEDVAGKLASALDGPRQTDGRERIRHLSTEAVARRIVDVYQKVAGQEGSRRWACDS